MALKFTVTPTASASTNPQGITFGPLAVIELSLAPEKLINKDLTGLELTKIDLTGIYLSKGVLAALIPWAQIIAIQY